MLGRLFHLQVSPISILHGLSLTRSRGGNVGSIQTFLIISTCFLYLVAAGLFSKAVWLFETHKVRHPYTD